MVPFYNMYFHYFSCLFCCIYQSLLFLIPCSLLCLIYILLYSIGLFKRLFSTRMNRYGRHKIGWQECRKMSCNQLPCKLSFVSGQISIPSSGLVVKDRLIFGLSMSQFCIWVVAFTNFYCLDSSSLSGK